MVCVVDDKKKKSSERRREGEEERKDNRLAVVQLDLICHLKRHIIKQQLPEVRSAVRDL